VNKTLGQKKLEAIQPLTRKAWDAGNSDSEEGGSPGGNFLHARD
jgi:hypothetical protein